jgi:hypothetical protein
MEHASIGSAADIVQIARTYGAPLVSSHTDPRALAFAPRTQTRFKDDANADFAEFGTTMLGNLPHEGMLPPNGYTAIRDAGGTVGVLAFPFRKHGYPSDGSPYVANDCEGSSKSYAQMYLYSVDRMGGVGVAMSTDRGFNDFIAPRFGVHAAFKLKEEKVDSLKIHRRADQKRAQGNGVRYDRGFTFFHPSRFEFGEVSFEEEDSWKAMAYWAARRVSPLDARYNGLAANEKIPSSSQAGHYGRIESFAASRPRAKASCVVAAATRRSKSRRRTPRRWAGRSPRRASAGVCAIRESGASGRTSSRSTISGSA